MKAELIGIGILAAIIWVVRVIHEQNKPACPHCGAAMEKVALRTYECPNCHHEVKG